jgi:hypothetical protein
MKYLLDKFTVPALDAEAYERIFGKRSSSSKDARDQDTRESPAKQGEQQCPTPS